MFSTTHSNDRSKARFSLSRDLSEKMCGPLTWSGQPYFCWKKLATYFSHHRLSSCQFSWKTGDLFLVITVAFIHFHSFTRVSPIISGMQKICRSSCGAPFFWGPVRPNMLNMPKSAIGSKFQTFSALEIPENHDLFSIICRLLTRIQRQQTTECYLK